MKLALSVLILAFSTLVYAQADRTQQDQYHSFARNLDKTIRHVDGRGTDVPCPPDSLTLPSAKRTQYKKKTVTSLSETDAQKLFNDLKNQSDIPFAFSLAGCEQRAHEMSRLMMLKGITPLKAFVSVDQNKEPRLQIPHPQKANEVIRWKYHVAPIVMVEKGGKLQPYIIDPSMETAAVPLETWRSHMTSHNKKMKVRTDITDAGIVYQDSPMTVDLDDQEFNQHIKKSLQQFKEYQDHPFGEEEYMEDVLSNQ